MGKIRQTILLMLTLTPFTVLADDFTLQVKNNLSPGATLYIAVYRADQKSWDAPAEYLLTQHLPQKPTFSLPLAVPAGQYALRAFVDIDGNKTLNTRSLSRPTEPFASSVGSGRTQPSIHFDRSVLLLDTNHPNAVLTLRYPKGSRTTDTSDEPEPPSEPETP